MLGSSIDKIKLFAGLDTDDFHFKAIGTTGAAFAAISHIVAVRNLGVELCDPIFLAFVKLLLGFAFFKDFDGEFLPAVLFDRRTEGTLLNIFVSHTLMSSEKPRFHD